MYTGMFVRTHSRAHIPFTSLLFRAKVDYIAYIHIVHVLPLYVLGPIATGI